LHEKPDDLNKQANIYRKLVEMRSVLYREIDEKIAGAAEILCPDLFNRPLYELEKLPFRIETALKKLEDDSGKMTTVACLADFSREELFEKLRTSYFGSGTLNQLYSILSRYGVDK